MAVLLACGEFTPIHDNIVVIQIPALLMTGNVKYWSTFRIFSWERISRICSPDLKFTLSRTAGLSTEDIYTVQYFQDLLTWLQLFQDSFFGRVKYFTRLDSKENFSGDHPRSHLLLPSPCSNSSSIVFQKGSLKRTLAKPKKHIPLQSIPALTFTVLVGKLRREKYSFWILKPIGLVGDFGLICIPRNFWRVLLMFRLSFFFPFPWNSHHPTFSSVCKIR